MGPLNDYKNNVPADRRSCSTFFNRMQIREPSSGEETSCIEYKPAPVDLK